MTSPKFGLTPNCPPGFDETELRIAPSVIFILYYTHTQYDELSDWRVYLKGSDIELGDLFVGNQQLYLLAMQAITHASGVGWK